MKLAARLLVAFAVGVQLGFIPYIIAMQDTHTNMKEMQK